jgi:hypothetical protein
VNLVQKLHFVTARPRPKLALLVALGLLLPAVILALAFFLLPSIGAVSRDALNYSVTREVGGSVALGVSPCRERQDAWRCEVQDASNSGSAVYRVRRDGRCWTAVKVRSFGEEVPLAPRASGCVDFRDQLRLLDRL